MTERQIFISQPSTGQEEWEALKEPIFSGWLTQGPRVAAFEKNFAQKYGVKHAIATTSCTTALHLILMGLGIGPGDEVIIPSFTWVATANVVLYCGATPVFVDVDLQSYNLDPHQLAEKITSRTRAIIPVHLFGLCADMDAIREVAGDIPLVEDAACAVGSQYKGKYAGTLGIAAAFSFHPRKTLTTGEGGMITTNSDFLAETLNQLRNHGASISEEQRHHGPKPYLLPEFNLLGYNYRMTDMQGAVGLVQLQKVDELQAERAQWADFYTRELKSIDWLVTPHYSSDYHHAWQAYVCRVEADIAPYSRNEIMEKLQAQGISTRPGTHAVHQLNLYRERFQLSTQDFPVAHNCDAHTMALPLHNKMIAEDYHYIVKVLKTI